MLGAGTCLVRMATNNRLALDADRERLLTLLSVAAARPVTADVVEPIAAAAGYWQRGDKALANLRLVFADLPRLTSAADVGTLRDAADLLDDGMAPRGLMKALGFDTQGFDKFPRQPRVPAGSGRISGQWTNGSDGDAVVPSVSIGRPVAADAEITRPPAHSSAPRLPIVTIADDGRVKPGGQVIVPRDDPGPLDPASLNTPLNPAEEQAIADTLNMIARQSSGPFDAKAAPL